MILFFSEDEAYVNSQANSDRKLAPDFYDVLADDLKTGSDQCQRFKHALFRLGLTCKLNVVNGESKFITASDAKKMSSKDVMAKVVTANKLMEGVRDCLAKGGVDMATALCYICDFEHAVVLHVGQAS